MTHPDMKSALLAAAEDFAFAPKDSAERKACPVASGVLAYFADALVLVSRLSRIGNDKHNPGQPLHWAKEKSGDEADALMRHLLDHLRGEPIDRDVEELGALAHLTQVAWRALAMLQRACDAERAATAKREAPATGPDLVETVEGEPCDHGVKFYEDYARQINMTSPEVRQFFPRLEGKCPKGCGFEGIAYASKAHFAYGDW